MIGKNLTKLQSHLWRNDKTNFFGNFRLHYEIRRVIELSTKLCHHNYSSALYEHSDTCGSQAKIRVCVFGIPYRTRQNSYGDSRAVL
jgi:hypothetical protein